MELERRSASSCDILRTSSEVSGWNATEGFGGAEEKLREGGGVHVYRGFFDRKAVVSRVVGVLHVFMRGFTWFGGFEGRNEE